MLVNSLIMSGAVALISLGAMAGTDRRLLTPTGVVVTIVLAAIGSFAFGLLGSASGG